MEEIWKDVVGYEGYYEVSNMGRVRSVDRISVRTNRLWKSRIRKQSIGRLGYVHLVLHRDGKQVNHDVHKLVASAFIDNTDPNKTQINHINEIKHDNRVENLEWCTSSYNQKHGSVRFRRIKSINKRGGVNAEKFVTKLSLNGIAIKTYKSVAEASRENNIERSQIRKACNGIYSQSGGYLWRFGIEK